MHQDAAKCVMAEATPLILAAVDVLRKADKFGTSALVGELRRILQQQHRASGRFKTYARRVEMPAQDVAFAHPLIGEKPIGRFGVGPILAGERNALSDPAAHSDQKLAKPRAKARILEAALVNFIIDPMGGVVPQEISSGAT